MDNGLGDSVGGGYGGGGLGARERGDSQEEASSSDGELHVDGCLYKATSAYVLRWVSSIDAICSARQSAAQELTAGMPGEEMHNRKEIDLRTDSGVG